MAQGKQSGTLSEISDVERAFYEMTRIRKEIDGVISFLASRMPVRGGRGPSEVIDPRTGRKFHKSKKR